MSCGSRQENELKAEGIPDQPNANAEVVGVDTEMGNQAESEVVYDHSDFIPLPVEYLDYALDEEMTWGFGIKYELRDNVQPENRISFSAGLNPSHPDKVTLSGRHGTHSFIYELESIAEFLVFLDFIETNQEIFFDYSEFPDPPDENWSPYLLDMDEYFFVVTGMKADNLEFEPCIAKGIDPGGNTPPEIVAALDYIKANFVDVWLANEPPE